MSSKQNNTRFKHFMRFDINFLKNALEFIHHMVLLSKMNYSEMFQIVYKMLPCHD